MITDDFSTKYKVSDLDFEYSFRRIWDMSILDDSKVDDKIDFVLGGQPGSGKSSMTKHILEQI